MEVKPGYKQTEVGVIPQEWSVTPLEAFTQVVASGKSKHSKALGTYPVHGSTGIIGYTESPEYEGEAILVARVGANAGRINVVSGRYGVTDNTIMLRLGDTASLAFIWRSLEAKRLNSLVFGSGQPLITGSQLKSLKLSTPPLPEQCAIAEALGDVDVLLNALDRLIAKKRDLKQAAMQQLLTGKIRLPGFSGEWEVKRIAEIGIPSSEKNTDGATLPVLTCSKYFGFMDSLGFFKNQVFSKDLSTYRVIRRDEIGYPANHVEEGSIGLQDLYEIALVSPIYVVFRVAEEVSTFFLYRLLKLDSYRQRFKTATTSSVDRRGSLRWRTFSEITVELPLTKAEQNSIATVLSDIDAELAALEARRDKTRDLKQAMMQELLTGKTRLVKPEAALA